MNRLRVGAMFRCTTEPEALPGFARRVEAFGHDDRAARTGRPEVLRHA